MAAPERSLALGARTGSRATAGARFLAGALLAGYGALIVTDVLAHESRGVGLGLLAGGALLLAWSAAASPRDAAPRADAADASPARAVAVAAAGAVAAGGVLAYNGATSSSLSGPELAILAYGVALVAAAPMLNRSVGRADVGTLVAWSFPLLAAPLAVYAFDAAISSAEGGSPIDWLVEVALVAPMGRALAGMGFDVRTVGQTLLLATPRGTLALSVGLVCAGFEPGVLFLGVFGLYAWRQRTPPRRLLGLLALGLVGVYVANLVRLIALALVGYRWGGVALQEAHAHLGWILFVGWMLVYWWIVLRRLEGPPDAVAP